MSRLEQVIKEVECIVRRIHDDYYHYHLGSNITYDEEIRLLTKLHELAIKAYEVLEEVKKIAKKLEKEGNAKPPYFLITVERNEG